MKILNNDKILKIILPTMLMIALALGCVKTDATESKEKQIDIEQNKVNVLYNTHIQNDGWEKDFSKKNGDTSGTSGRSLRLEAIKIKLDNLKDVSIKYQTHIQNVGWQDWKKNGEMAGTSGQALRLEGIRIQLENSDEYSVQYRVHVQNIGWQDWKTDGEMAGTEGQALRLEAIEIKIIPKKIKGIVNIETPTNSQTVYTTGNVNVKGWKLANVSNTSIKAYIDNKQIEINKIEYFENKSVIESVEGYGNIIQNPKAGFKFNIDSTGLTDGNHNIKIELIKADKVIATSNLTFKLDKNIHVQYRSHVQNIGWQNYVEEGKLSGTTGKSYRVEAMNIKLVNAPKEIKIKYKAHVQNIGWRDWQENDAIAGTEGKSLRVEAIKIKLDGTEEYTVMYRTHVENIGWQEWCYDGETSGTIGESKRIEAIEIKLVPKAIKNKTWIYIDNPGNQIPNVSQTVNGWVMTNTKDASIKMFIDNVEIKNTLKRAERQDVLNEIKGYGDEDIYNKTPGFETTIDFSKYPLGNHVIKIQVLKDKEVLAERTKQFSVRKKIEISKGIYGVSGLKAIGNSRGNDLTYYKYGSGPNVFYGTYAIHGFEDKWYKDGFELVDIANNFYNQLVNSNDYDLAEKWTIYLFPGVNVDGLYHGTTNNGPGRTTLFSQAPNNKGIDLNRCWQIGSTYTRYTDNRNYNGTTGFQAYEAQYLRDFLLKNKSKNGQTVLIDLHGWTQQVIGDEGICSYYSKQFPQNDRSAVGRYGTGYLINWARNSLGSSTKAARTALIELPDRGVTGHQSVIDNNFSGRYIQATLDVLRNI